MNSKNIQFSSEYISHPFSSLFPIAFYKDLHADFGINFQMNRCYNFSNDNEIFNEMRKVSPLIHTYSEFINEFLKFYEKSLQNGHKLRAAHYLRTAEFYVKCLVNQGNKLHKFIFNWAIGSISRKKLMIERGVAQSMHVMGAKAPYDFLRKRMLFNTREISPLVELNLLLLSGQEDHYIPQHPFFDQQKMLTNVRSLTARLFTRKETAQNHCQLGNIRLSVKIIVDWIEQMINI